MPLTLLCKDHGWGWGLPPLSSVGLQVEEQLGWEAGMEDDLGGERSREPAQGVTQCLFQLESVREVLWCCFEQGKEPAVKALLHSQGVAHPPGHG